MKKFARRAAPDPLLSELQPGCEGLPALKKLSSATLKNGSAQLSPLPEVSSPILVPLLRPVPAAPLRPQPRHRAARFTSSTPKVPIEGKTKKMDKRELKSRLKCFLQKNNKNETNSLINIIKEGSQATEASNN